MSTKERILNASLSLFNEEGEASTSAVDIANALDMSPGNLYYHFKGKDEIIPALFDLFEEEILIILNSGPKDIRAIEDQWIFSYIVLEEIWDFRFFYRNLNGLLNQYPRLVPKFKRLLTGKRKAIRANLDQLVKLGFLHIEDVLQDVLIEQMLLSFTYCLNLDQLENRQTSAKIVIHQNVFQIMSLSVPYMGENGYSVLQGMIQMLADNTKGE